MAFDYCYGSSTGYWRKGDMLKVINCRAHEYRHLYPLPSALDVAMLYASDKFYNEAQTGWFAKEKTEHDAGLWRAAYEYRAELLYQDLGVLDIGCGAGWFGEYWNKTRTTCAIGIEPSRAAREYGIGRWDHPFMYTSLDTYNDDRKQAKSPYRIGMNVHASLVLEHLVDPRREVEAWADLLGRDGRMLIVVPNDFSRLQHKVGGDHWVDQKHINYFTPESLRNLLQACGLNVIHESATFPMELFIRMGRDYRGDDALGFSCHMKRLRFEQRLGVRAFTIYQMLYKMFGWGRELIFVAKRGY